jgi:hypothetical protein
MSDPLSIYLHDHLAGADMAIDLLKAMKEREKEEHLGEFARHLLPEVEQDQQTLQQLADSTGSGGNVLKEFTAWLSEKVSRFKLGQGAAEEFGTFEALEFLALGVLGKVSLWRALQVAAKEDPRLRHLDFERLIARAEAQHAEVEQKRLALVPIALKPAK